MSNNNSIKDHKYLFHYGNNYRSFELFGAHPVEEGYVFRVWAPRAVAISLVGSFNDWNLESHPMSRLEDDDTIFEVVCKEAKEGDLYKYAITTDDGRVLYKADPYAFANERADLLTTQRASIIYNTDKKFVWHDKKWIKERGMKNPYKSPMSIYEVHLGSWRKNEDGSYKTYEELSTELIQYVKKMGYTHIELLPVMEHPFDGSWGYQVTGYYSTTGRYGSPEGFKKLVDAAHRNNIGVIIDWVPAHFVKDGYGLIEFDGHYLYEYSDPLKREHKGWGTRAFDFGRPEVISFLVSNAYFFCEKYHVDGIRVDAVSALIYLNYCREDGEWMPNEDGGVENKEAMKFIQKLNTDVQSDFPGVLMIAEESTAWPNVTMPPTIGGLGFNFKWNMGWMNDSLEYFKKDPVFRSYAHHKLTFSLTYAYSENFILPISHDEVVHGKKSMVDKMPGEYDDKFAQLRAFYVYMYTHPGKKLSFMGNEIGQFIEWNEKRELDWFLLEYEKHHKMQSFVKKLNNYYKDTPALWLSDNEYEGFTWIDADNTGDNVYTYYRTAADGSDDVVLAIINLSGRDYTRFDVGVPDAYEYVSVIDTDRIGAGGTGRRKKARYKVKKGSRNGLDKYITINMPKFSAVILERRTK